MSTDTITEPVVPATTEPVVPAPASVAEALYSEPAATTPPVVPAAEPAPVTEGATPTDGEPKAEVPEKYEFALPEGFALDEELASKFEPVARELKLTNEQAQKLVDIYAEREAASAKAHDERWKAQIETWNTQLRTDKEIGGHNYEGNIKAAQSALARFGTPELKEALHVSGLGSHPELVKFFIQIGKSMSEDAFHGSTTTSDAAAPIEQRMYPSMNKTS